MCVRVRYLCVDLPGCSGVKEVEVAEGATVRQVLTEHARLCSLEDSLGKLPDSMFLVGKNPARLDTVLSNDDELFVMRILHGG